MQLNTQKSHRGFTLMELLVTMLIIVVVVTLSTVAFKAVTKQQALKQAEIQLQLISQALESYKLDNSRYPTVQDGDDTGSNSLFLALYWDSDTYESQNYETDSAAPEKGDLIYLDQFATDSNKQNWLKGSGANTTIVDPWASEYRYEPYDPTLSPPNTINPDFDLKSKGPDGATNDSNPNAAESQDDIANY